MKTIRTFITGFTTALILLLAIQAFAGIASFKLDLVTAVQNNFVAADRTRIVNAFAAAYGYQATINGSPNPQTKADFAADRIVDYVRNVVQATEQQTSVAAVPTPTPLPN